MATTIHPDPTVLVIFGAGGDLTMRKLLPALYNLWLDHYLPEQFTIVGVDRKPMSDAEFGQHLRQAVDEFSRRGKTKDNEWKQFVAHLAYLAADFNDAAAFTGLAGKLAAQDKSWKAQANHVFYLAISPTLIELVSQQLGKAGLAKDTKRARLVAEKPFGRDLASACELNRALTAVFAESQVYRIDHYLGKETVQNIMAFRFANSLFEPVWNRRYIDHVQITVAEQVGVEQRAGYYDHSGTLRDMVQNHMLQVLCLIAMEPPVNFGADELRSKKVDVLRAIRPLPVEQVPQLTVRGQYGAGTIDGQKVPGYRDEPGVAPGSATDTYAAAKLLVDNWRWQDVPFYLRTGKRLFDRVSEVSIHFRPVPHRSFPATAVTNWQANRLAIRIQPQERILLDFQAKEPGPTMQLAPVDMRFTYQEAFNKQAPEAYETLLLDIMLGDATLFMRADQVEAAWSVVTPIQEAWAATKPTDFPNYAAGSAGPAAADSLIQKDGRKWLLTPQDSKK
jgi:glucose-6-phosphate 1-dehydrogenase